MNEFRRQDSDGCRRDLEIHQVFRFLRPACEVKSGVRLVAAMEGRMFTRAGEITTPQATYRIGRGRMQRLVPDGRFRAERLAATYEIREWFLMRTRAVLVDCTTGRRFELRQKRPWSLTHVLSESGSPVAECTVSILQPTGRMTVHRDVPESVLLLSIWLDAVAGIFSA